MDNLIKSAGKFVFKTLILLIVFSAMLEGIARLPWPTEGIPPLSKGNYSLLDIKFSRIEDYAQENNGVDAIIFGSSLAHTGLDPEIIERIFQQETGQKLRVFNFGVNGISLPPATSLIEIVTQTYNPSLIIHVTEMRDYHPQTGMGMAGRVADDPWLRYKLGKPSPWGWVIDHSMAIQRYLSFRFWAREDFPSWYALLERRLIDITPWGYEPDRHVDDRINEPPNPNEKKDQHILETYKNYQVDPKRIGFLETILHQPDRKVIILGMPVHPTTVEYFGNPQEDYQEFLTTVEETARTHGGKFIATANLTIPDEGYANKFHLNQSGAPIFSEFLAKELVHLYNSGWYQPSSSNMRGRRTNTFLTGSLPTVLLATPTPSRKLASARVKWSLSSLSMALI
ncbi:MAG: hypothetical protein MAG431_00669 [Chloroflexi bacterium]|nr:hypothetical protein [Chloroflexota bacterium]